MALDIKGEIDAVESALAELGKVDGQLKTFADSKSHSRLTGAEKDQAESLQAQVRGKIEVIERHLATINKKIQMNKAELDKEDHKLLKKVEELKEIEQQLKEKRQEYLRGIERRMPVAFGPAEIKRRRDVLLNLFKQLNENGDAKQKIVVAGEGYALAERGMIGQTGRTLVGKEAIDHALYFIPRYNDSELDHELLHVIENNAWAREVLKNNSSLEDKFNKFLLLEQLQKIDIKDGNNELDELAITDHAAQRILHHDIDLSPVYQAKNTSLIQAYAELIRDIDVILQKDPNNSKLFSVELKGKLHSQIQGTEGTAKKILIMERWVWVAEQCRAMGDYAGAHAIATALNEPQLAEMRGHLSSKARECLSNYLDANKMIKNDVISHVAVMALPVDWLNREDLKAKKAEIERYQDYGIGSKGDVKDKQGQLFLLMNPVPAKGSAIANATDIIRNDYDYAPRFDHFSNMKIDAVVSNLQMAIQLYRQHLREKKDSDILRADESAIENKFAFINKHIKNNLQKTALADVVGKMEMEFNQLKERSAEQSVAVSPSVTQPPEAKYSHAEEELQRVVELMKMDNQVLTDLLVKGGDKYRNIFARKDLEQLINNFNSNCVTDERVLKDELTKFGINDLSDVEIKNIAAENRKMLEARDARYRNNVQKINNLTLRKILLGDPGLFSDALLNRNVEAKINIFNAADISDIRLLNEALKGLGVNSLTQEELKKIVNADQLQKNSSFHNKMIDELANVALREIIKVDPAQYIIAFSDSASGEKIKSFNNARPLNEKDMLLALKELDIDTNQLSTEQIQKMLTYNRDVEIVKARKEAFEQIKNEINHLLDLRNSTQFDQVQAKLDELTLIQKNLIDNVSDKVLLGDLPREINQYYHLASAEFELAKQQIDAFEKGKRLITLFENPKLRHYLSHHQDKMDELINDKNAEGKVAAFNALCCTDQFILKDALSHLGVKDIPAREFDAILNANKIIEMTRKIPNGISHDKLLACAKKGEIESPETAQNLIRWLSAIDVSDRAADHLAFLQASGITGFDAEVLSQIQTANRAAAQARLPIIDVAPFMERFERIKADFKAIEDHVPVFDHTEKHRRLLAKKVELDQILEELLHPSLRDHVEVKRLHAEVEQFRTTMDEKHRLATRHTQGQTLQIEIEPGSDQSRATRAPASENRDTNGRYYINDKDYYEKHKDQFSYKGPASDDVEKMLTHAYQAYGLPDSNAKVTLSGSEELVKQAYIYYKARGVEVVLKQHTALASDQQVQAEVDRKRAVFARKEPTEIGVHESKRVTSAQPAPNPSSSHR